MNVVTMKFWCYIEETSVWVCRYWCKLYTYRTGTL